MTGSARRLAFVVPPAPTRHLPLYELALETRNYLTDRGSHEVGVTVVTPESSLLAPFGPGAGDELSQLLVERDIQRLRHVRRGDGLSPPGELSLSDQRTIAADHVVAMARLEGLRIPGIPCGRRWFVSVDGHCRVLGFDDVYAAGDMTSFPIKHGGLATQQADAAAEMIASSVGIPIEPRPFQPILRGQLLTGMFPRYLRLDADADRHTWVPEAPWWPPAKIVGRYLTPFLMRELGLARTDPPAGVESDDKVIEWQPGGWAPV